MCSTFERLRGNLNKAVAFASLDSLKDQSIQLQELERKLLQDRLSKSEKEMVLREVRKLRKDLSLPDLPPYNSPEFKEALESS